ncbi:MAG: response regulator, partial [Ignavibacteriaceae bacterium]
TTHVTKLFSKKVFNIDSVTNGPNAVEAVKSKPYSAILMDIHLGKGMSGLDTLKIIRTIHGYENIPIIAFTAYAMQGSKKDFLAAGCTHYLVKPFTKDQLIDLLNEAIKTN